MKTALLALHITVSILLIFAILIQQRGTGLSATFGGGGSNFYAAKRGAEKILGIITIVLAVLFAGLSLSMLFV
ncbi:MAG: preprotein translocase subunit SecG [Candidatus Gracilibacteria bacterium]|jgi:preprotein translocase subunit SecG